MKINFTKKEYRLLLDIVYLGQWMIDAHKSGEEAHDEEYEMLSQKVYSFAKQMGCGDVVESDKSHNMYFPTREYEESGIHEIIENYNSDTFWDELVSRLVEREVSGQVADENKDISSAEEYFKLSEPFEDMFAKEFLENGIKNLVLKKP